MRARWLIIAVLMAEDLGAWGQADIWKQVRSNADLPQPKRVTPSDAKLKSIAALLSRADPNDIWGCDGSEREEMIKELTYLTVPIAKDKQVLLAEAPPGCARGGQGSNGAMWLIQFEGEKPVVLASPKDEFNGWLYAIQPTESHGYRDVVLGWHMSASEAGLTYFRFDGRAYVAIGSATRTKDDHSNVKIVANAK